MSTERGKQMSPRRHRLRIAGPGNSFILSRMQLCSNSRKHFPFAQSREACDLGFQYLMEASLVVPGRDRLCTLYPCTSVLSRWEINPSPLWYFLPDCINELKKFVKPTDVRSHPVSHSCSCSPEGIL